MREPSLIEKNTFSSRVKLLREPWCETGRSADGAIIRIPASLIREIVEPLYIAVLQPFSFLHADGQQSDLRRSRFAFRRYAQIASIESAKQSDDRGLRERFQKAAIEHRCLGYRR